MMASLYRTPAVLASWAVTWLMLRLCASSTSCTFAAALAASLRLGDVVSAMSFWIRAKTTVSAVLLAMVILVISVAHGHTPPPSL